jgi:hypothetical protein
MGPVFFYLFLLWLRDSLSLSHPQFRPSLLSPHLSLSREERSIIGLPTCDSHASIASLTSGLSSSSLVDVATLGRAALSLSYLLSIVGTQGETLILFDLCNVMLLVVDFRF